MVSLNAMNALDRILRDITVIDKLFGGKVFLFGGDLRQVFPVIKKGMPTSIIELCLKEFAPLATLSQVTVIDKRACN